MSLFISISSRLFHEMSLCRKIHPSIQWKFCQKVFRHGERLKSSLPLTDIRVLDMTRVLAGPFATMVLGDLGAEIIKIERPGSGDDTRAWGPPFQGNESIYFMSVNRNKKSICVDFKKEEGLKIIKDLLAKSDVLIENYLPGKLATVGLDYDSLKKDFPRLIYCSISGFGQEGPSSKKAGYDLVASAIGGLMHITGPEGGDPCRVGVAITDITTGLYAHGAIMAAVIERFQTGEGKYIDCSLLSTQVALISHLAASYLNAGMDTGRLGTAHQSIVPYQGFKTNNGYMVVGTGNNRQFQELCKVMGLKELSDDVKFQDNSARVKNRNELLSVLQTRFEEESTEHWLEKFDSCTFPFGPVNSLEAVFEDRQVRYLNLVDEFVHPNAGNVKVVGPAVAYNGQRKLRQTMPSPTIGEHTKQLLSEMLGYSGDKIENLRQLGAIHFD
ncbi:succinate--hydroxymethylglutarate CoA-transferase-like isoform X1 [Rhopilema esculentum]|uniref:succinate--hydroxymethylglutarate CoA-transferase-like isoform X1 n=2 Tax=Rhopilema esculentum TaxID=499914 RepID=UPI0031DDC19F